MTCEEPYAMVVDGHPDSQLKVYVPSQLLQYFDVWPDNRGFYLGVLHLALM